MNPFEPTIRIFSNGKSYISTSVVYSDGHITATLRPVGGAA